MAVFQASTRMSITRHWLAAMECQHIDIKIVKSSLDMKPVASPLCVFDRMNQQSG